LIYVRNRGYDTALLKYPAGSPPAKPGSIVVLHAHHPRFETGDARYAWLNRIVCVATGARRAAAVVLEVFEVK
jgi:hypothetical protein